MERPEIIYPCQWGYRLIGTDGEAMKCAVEDVLSGKEYELSFSNISSAGTYISLELTVFVETEEVRNRIYAALSTHPAMTRVI